MLEVEYTGNQMLNIPTKKVRVQQHPVGRDRKKPRRRTETPNIFQAETKYKWIELQKNL